MKIIMLVVLILYEKKSESEKADRIAPTRIRTDI